jgi:uncharacterized protein YifE (UPF0438 family)
MTNTDKLRQHYLTMPRYHFDMTIDDYHFSDKDQTDIAKYGNWFQAIWLGQVPLVTDKLKHFYAAKSPNAKNRGKFEELWYQYKLRELPF